MSKSNLGKAMSDSEKVDQLIAGITDWRGKTFAVVRKAVLEADKEIIEEFKWRGTPLWSRNGMIAVGNAFKGKFKMTFAYGAKFADPDKLFNADFAGNTRRAIEYFEGDKVDAPALKKLVRAAIEHNQSKLKKNAKKTAAKKAAAPAKKAPKARKAKK
jgi:hypothetical protein